jgi:hypothetical protein
MAAEIALRPNDDRGREILDELEEQTEMKPMELVDDDNTRCYYLSAKDADDDGFDLVLDKIDGQWREHVTNLAGQQGD